MNSKITSMHDEDNKHYRQTFTVFLPSELSHHIFGAIFENQNRSFIHFSCSEINMARVSAFWTGNSDIEHPRLGQFLILWTIIRMLKWIIAVQSSLMKLRVLHIRAIIILS